MNTKENIFDAHAEHVEWTNKLAFYKDELKVLEHRLEEIATKNTHTDVLSQVEKYQNQFIVQRENIDQIEHIINLEEDKIAKEVNSNPVAVDHRKIETHPGIHDVVNTFELSFSQLRVDFNKFLAKWM